MTVARPTDVSLVEAFWTRLATHALCGEGLYKQETLNRVISDARWRDECNARNGKTNLPTRGELLVEIESLRRALSEARGKTAWVEGYLDESHKREDILLAALGRLRPAKEPC